MSISSRIVAALVVVVAIAAPAHATITPYTNSAAFLAAAGVTGVDSYNDLPLGFGPSPYARSAGSFSYLASSVAPEGGADAFFNSGTVGDVWLSTDTGNDRVVFSGFASNVRGFGGRFFGVNNDGAFFANQPLLVTFTDTSSSLTQTLLGLSTGSFLGFVTTDSILSVTVQLGADASLFAYPAINDLILAGAIPEPGDYALFAIGIGGLSLVSRRRRGAEAARIRGGLLR